MLNYCKIYTLPIYTLALQQGFSARYAHNSIYLSFKYADDVAIQRMCAMLICLTTIVLIMVSGYMLDVDWFTL